MGVSQPVVDRIVVRDHDPETIQLIRDFLEPLGYLVECVPGIGEVASATDEKP
jgi:CheY-like chemotaxis protein